MVQLVTGLWIIEDYTLFNERACRLTADRSPRPHFSLQDTNRCDVSTSRLMWRRREPPSLQLPQDAALDLIGRYLDSYHASVVIVQCHCGVEVVGEGPAISQWGQVLPWSGGVRPRVLYRRWSSSTPSSNFFLLNYLILIFNDCYCMI